MIDLINTKVQHKLYGEGTILSINDVQVMTIKFAIGEKRFKYPEAFCKALESAVVAIQQEAEAAWTKNVEEIAEQAARDAANKNAARISNANKAKVSNVLHMYTSEEKEKIEAKLYDVLSSIGKSIVFADKTQRLFMVHQGKTYYEESTGGFIWAPVSGIHHHERVNEIHKGDIIFNYANGALQSLSEALSDCFFSPRPQGLSGHGWDNIGYRVQLRYHNLSASLAFDNIRQQIINNRAHIYSSFDVYGNACQGYMYELEIEIARLIKAEILKSNQPKGVVDVLNRFN